MNRTVCIRYLLVFIATLVLIAIISFVLQTYFQIDIGSAGTIVTIMVPALDAGTNYYNKLGEAPSKGIRWKFARYFTAIQFIFAAIILALLWNFIPELSALSSSVGIAIMFVFVIFYMVMTLLVSRYFFGLGINTAEKVAKKTA